MSKFNQPYRRTFTNVKQIHTLDQTYIITLWPNQIVPFIKRLRSYTTILVTTIYELLFSLVISSNILALKGFLVATGYWNHRITLFSRLFSIAKVFLWNEKCHIIMTAATMAAAFSFIITSVKVWFDSSYVMPEPI